MEFINGHYKKCLEAIGHCIKDGEINNIRRGQMQQLQETQKQRDKNHRKKHCETPKKT